MQALSKYGFTPLELIKELSTINLTQEMKEAAIKDLKMYFGEPPVSNKYLSDRLSSGLLEMQVLAKYTMTIRELMQ